MKRCHNQSYILPQQPHPVDLPVVRLPAPGLPVLLLLPRLGVLLLLVMLLVRASNKGSGRFHNHGEGPNPTWAFSWLEAPTSAFTFNTLLRHYAKGALIPWSLIVKLGP